MKKFLSLLLVVSMVICFVPTFVVSAADVIEIATAEDFKKISDNLSGSYKLTADITITEAISYKNEDENARFKGTLDGDGHTLTIDLYDNDNARFGIFCSAEGCTIKNLNVKGTLYSSGNSTGVLIGTVKDSGSDSTVTIDNVTTDVDIYANNHSLGQGGFIGCVEDKTTVNITNSKNFGTIIGEVTGGFIGKNRSDSTITFENCINNGDVLCLCRYSDYRGAGGFIGASEKNNAKITLTNCTNNGTISAWYLSANAFVAHNNLHAANYVVDNCTNNGKVLSGGCDLPDAQDFVQDTGTWSWGNLSFNAETNILTGSPNFHATPDITNFKAYLNGVEATDKVTLEVNEGARQLSFSADFTGIDATCGFRAVTFIWDNGRYATFGVPTVIGDKFQEAGGCGFIDSNLNFDKQWPVERLTDIKVLINGNQAYWNDSYLGLTHCGLNQQLQLGIVGADIVKGVNSIVFTSGTDTHYTFFNSRFNSLGYSYARTVMNDETGKVTATVIFNNDPKLVVGTTFSGRAHDDHNNTTTFTVTAYDAETGTYTIEAENYFTSYSLLELQITSECAYKGYYVALTVHEKNGIIAEPSLQDVEALDGLTQIKLSNATAVKGNGEGFGNASNLVDGQDGNFTTGGKLEGGWPGFVSITVDAEKAVDPTYLVFYTDDDGNYPNRAPKTVKVYGSNDKETWTEIGYQKDLRIENVNNSGFPMQLDANVEYKYFKVDVIAAKSTGHFQIEELVLYTSNEMAARQNDIKGAAAASEAGISETLTPAQNGYQLYYQTKKSDKAGCTDYRFIAVATKDLLDASEFAKIYAEFTNGTDKKTLDVEFNVAYYSVSATDGNGLKTTYTATENAVILGVVVKGVPAGYYLDTKTAAFIAE